MAGVPTVGRWYSWGSNGSGQLGHDDSVDRLQPTHLGERPPFDGVITAITCGPRHTVVTTANMSVYHIGHGANDVVGQSIGTHISQLMLSPMQRAYRVSCGWEHTAIVTESGDLLTYGHNQHFAVGHTHRGIAAVSIPFPAVSVGCGWKHTVAVCANGYVYAFGDNSTGQCGVADTKKVTAPTRVAVDVADGDMIVDVCCGWKFTVLRTRRGRILAFGTNVHCQIAADKCRRVDSALAIQTLNERNIIAVSCGWSHVVALTADGTVYCWGRNDRGQCGIDPATDNSRSCIWPPETPHYDLDENESVVDVRAGSEHTAILTSQRVLTCGWNEHGNLSHVTRANTPSSSSDYEWRFDHIGIDDIDMIATGGASMFIRVATNIDQKRTNTAERLSIISEKDFANLRR